jgi:hypothetical protein
VKEEKREKKVFTLPGQKHEPPEEVSVINISFWNILLCKKKSSHQAEGFYGSTADQFLILIYEVYMSLEVDIHDSFIVGVRCGFLHWKICT